MTIEQLKPKLENQRALLLHCKALLSDYVFLTDTLIPKPWGKKTIGPFWKKLQQYFLGLLYLEIYKLYSQGKNEKHSLYKTLNLLKNNHKNSNWKSKIKLDEISYLINQLEREKTKNIITNIKDIRDKKIAHFDTKMKPDSVFIDDIEHLVKIGNAIINDLLRRLFDTNMLKGFDSKSKSGSEYLFEISLEDFSKEIGIIEKLK